jgi:hypothetical protein
MVEQSLDHPNGSEDHSEHLSNLISDLEGMMMGSMPTFCVESLAARAETIILACLTFHACLLVLVNPEEEGGTMYFTSNLSLYQDLMDVTIQLPPQLIDAVELQVMHGN